MTVTTIRPPKGARWQPGAPRPSRPSPASGIERRRRNAVRAVVVGTVLLPLLRPAGPGNTAPVDVFMMAAIGFAALWAVGSARRLRLPYVLPVGVMMTAGALAALFGSYQSQGLVALAQDLLLLGWCGAVAIVGQDPAAMRAIVRAWAVTAIVAASLTLIGSVGHIAVLSGTTARTGARAAFTLGDANLAANYFVASLFVIAAVRYPAGRLRRVGSYAVLIVAVILTGSNGAPVALMAGLGVAAAISLGRRRGIVYATAGVAVGLLLAAGAASFVNMNQVASTAAQYGQLGKDWLGHSNESTSSRSTLLHETLGLYFHGSPLGRGPGSTKLTLHADQAPYVKEAHNDYTATLVERGVLGGVGLVLLFGVVVVRSWSTLARPRSAASEEAVPYLAPLVGAFVAMAVSGAFYQVLHFRHLWTLLGILAALYAGAGVESRVRSPARQR